MAQSQRRYAHPLGWSLVLLVMLTLTAVAWVRGGGVALSSEVEITIHDGDSLINWRTQAKTVGEVLTEAGIELRLFDEIEPGVTRGLEDVDTITIRRAQAVTVLADGQVHRLLTVETGVGSILAQLSIELAAWDHVVPGLEQELDNGTITVHRVWYEMAQETREIPYEHKTRDDPQLEVGFSRLVQRGTPGKLVVTFRESYTDGQLASREVVNEEVLVAAAPEIVARGAKHIITIMGQEYRISRAIIARRVTAYDPGPLSTGKWADGLTKTGIPAGEGVVAVDPSVVPLGSRLYIEGYGFAVAADVGSAITGTALDVCFDTREEALSWGVKRNVKFYILE